MTHAAAARVEDEWAAAARPPELERLREGLQHLLTELRSRWRTLTLDR